MGDDPLLGFCTSAVRFERLLGKGAMGAVYCGVQLSLQRPVAIKVIASHLTEDPAYLARFEREAHTLGRLVHPHVIACHDFGPSPGPDGKPMYLMVMEFVDGWSLGWLAKNKRVTVRSVLELHRQTADGLGAAHALGIVHRDIKPDNILVTRDGQAKIADFGLARELSQESDLTAAGSILGSPGFMSPETCRGLEPTAASDIYSLGCSLVQVLSGAPVYSNASALAVMQMHISEPIPHLADRRPELASLQDIVDRCLAKDPAQRIGGAKALAQELAERIPSFSRALVAGKQVQGSTPAAGGSSRMTATSVSMGSNVAAAAPDGATISTTYIGRRASARKRKTRIVVIAACVLVPTILALVIAGHGSAQPPPATGARADPHPAAATASPSTTASSPSPQPSLEASSPTVQQAPALDPDAADRARLAHIDEMIDRHDLDHAESALADLVVTGELKQVRKALDEKLAAARVTQGTAISAELDAAKALMRTDPRAAAERLRALSIPEHFTDLDDARQQLLAQADNSSASAPATPAVPLATAAQATHLAARGEGRICKFGSAELPGPQPFGASIFLESLEHVTNRSGDIDYVRIHLPPGSEKDGFLAFVHAKGAANIYAREMVDGTREGGPQLAFQLTGKDWELIRVPLSFQTAAPRLLILLMRFQDGPFWFAGGALGGSGMPTWDNLRMVPGTLTTGSAVNLPLAALRGRHTNFPLLSQIRLALPDVDKGTTQAQAAITSVCQAFGLDAKDVAGSWPASHQAFYAAGNDRYAVLDQLASARDAVGIAIAALVLSSAHPPTFRASDLAPAFLASMRDERNPVLPVLVLSAEAASPEAHTPWATLERQLRELVPGLPIIDLNIAALDIRRLGGALDLSSPQWAQTRDTAFQGGFAELLGRLRTQ